MYKSWVFNNKKDIVRNEQYQSKCIDVLGVYREEGTDTGGCSGTLLSYSDVEDLEQLPVLNTVLSSFDLWPCNLFGM